MEKVNPRENSPSWSRSPGKNFCPPEDDETYQKAMNKLVFSAWRFDRETNGDVLKIFESKELEKDFFRRTLRSKMDCRLSSEEFDALMPHFDNNGFVDGCEFLLLFYRVRFEYKSKLLTERLQEEKRIRRENELLMKRRKEDFESRQLLKLPTNFSEEDLKKAMEQLTEAAVRYDRLMPGAIQLDGFSCESLRPELFKEQLKLVFNLHFTLSEFSALVHHLCKDNPDESDNIQCSSFLVMFFRLGFKERSERIKARYDESKRHREEREARLKFEQEEADRKNALKCSFEFTKYDEEKVLKKLKEAARLYDKSTPAAVSMKAFEVAFMPPHVFKDQLKRVFNLDVTPPELGALIKLFDDNGDGFISCAEFSKNFLALGFAEREKFLKDFREKQQRQEQARKEAYEKQQELLARKNALKCSFEFTEEEQTTAMHKLLEAAWRFDKKMPGAPNLAAFEMQFMEPHVFKEQLRRAFNLQVNNVTLSVRFRNRVLRRCCINGLSQLTPGELGAVMSYFNANEMGQIRCTDFINKFVGMGMEERSAQKQRWRQHQKEADARRKKEEEEKLEAAERKIAVSVGNFTEEEFQSAFSKLAYAALKYSKTGPGAIGLNAFEAETMPPHIFKEQLKLVFNCKVSTRELGALMSYFDKEGTGVIRCKDFTMQFFRTGIEERDRIHQGWRDEDKRKREKDKEIAKAKEEEQLLKKLREVDYDFTEQDFDSALGKLLTIAHNFDYRQLGPAGWKPFQGNCLTPSEFREVTKRIFNLKVNPQELGALVTYLDSSMKGTVSCASFMNNFVQLRIKCEEFKGRPDENQLLLDYHAVLKEAYKTRIHTQINESDEAKLRPWRIGLRPRKVSMKTECGPPPKDPAEKLKRRLKAGRRSGRMDLSTRCCWPAAQSSSQEIPAAATDSESQDSGVAAAAVVAVLAASSGVKKKKALKDVQPVDVAELVRQDEIIDPKDLLAYLRHPSGKHAVLSATSSAVEFVLYTVPTEVFKMTGLKQLWLTNNNVSALSSQIGDLRMLEVLCVSNNQLSSLPPEICLLQKLQRLYLRANQLTDLPLEFVQLQNVTVLDLGSNSLSSVPALCSLVMMQYLDLSFNRLTQLPAQFSKLRSLSYLDMSGNDGLVAQPEAFTKMSWTEVRGCPLLPETPKASKPYREVCSGGMSVEADEDDEIEMFLRARASSRITAKLRRRKRGASKEAKAAAKAADVVTSVKAI